MNGISISTNFFKEGHDFFLTKEQFFTYLFLASEERIHKKTIEVSTENLIRYGLLRNSKALSHFEVAQRILNQLHNKSLIRLYSFNEDRAKVSLSLTEKDFSIRSEQYFNILNQSPNLHTAYIYYYVMYCKHNKRDNISFEEIAKTSQISTEEVNSGIEWLKNNGMLIQKRNNNTEANNQKVYNIKEFQRR